MYSINVKSNGKKMNKVNQFLEKYFEESSGLVTVNEIMRKVKEKC